MLPRLVELEDLVGNDFPRGVARESVAAALFMAESEGFELEALRGV